MTLMEIINEDNLNFTKKLSQQMLFTFVVDVPGCSKFLEFEGYIKENAGEQCGVLIRYPFA